VHEILGTAINGLDDIEYILSPEHRNLIDVEIPLDLEYRIPDNIGRGRLPQQPNDPARVGNREKDIATRKEPLAQIPHGISRNALLPERIVQCKLARRQVEEEGRGNVIGQAAVKNVTS
jgi:hypothetical protein